MNATATPYKTNRHIVDQLADVRAQIKALEVREDELKAEISKVMGAADSLGGDEYIASQKASSRKGSLDPVKLQGALKISQHDLDRVYRKPDSAVVSIVLERRQVEAAA